MWRSIIYRFLGHPGILGWAFAGQKVSVGRLRWNAVQNHRLRNHRSYAKIEMAGWCLPLPAGTPQGTSLQYRPHRQTNLLLTVYPSSTSLGLNRTPYEGFLDQFFITEVANITVLSLTVTFHNDKIVVSPLFSLKTRKMNKKQKGESVVYFCFVA